MEFDDDRTILEKFQKRRKTREITKQTISLLVEEQTTSRRKAYFLARRNKTIIHFEVYCCEKL